MGKGSSWQRGIGARTKSAVDHLPYSKQLGYSILFLLLLFTLSMFHSLLLMFALWNRKGRAPTANMILSISYITAELSTIANIRICHFNRELHVSHVSTAKASRLEGISRPISSCSTAFRSSLWRSSCSLRRSPKPISHLVRNVSTRRLHLGQRLTGAIFSLHWPG